MARAWGKKGTDFLYYVLSLPLSPLYTGPLILVVPQRISRACYNASLHAEMYLRIGIIRFTSWGNSLQKACKYSKSIK